MTNYASIIYSNTGNEELGLLDKIALKAIREIEDDYINDSDYQRICLAIKPLDPNDAPICDR